MANYWAKVSTATNLQEEAMHASLRVRWNRSRFYGATDQQILQATFTCACGGATGGSTFTTPPQVIVRMTVLECITARVNCCCSLGYEGGCFAGTALTD